MKSLVILCLLFVAAVFAIKSEHEALRQFVAFQHKFNKSYKNDAEFKARFEIFKQNMAKAAEYQERETGTAKYGVTKFSDLSEEEFRTFYLMPKFSSKDMPSRPISNIAKSNSLPTQNSFDWNNKGAITPVKNQGQCGSCWAFSATETIESYWFLAGNTLTALSPEQIVDCDTNGEDEGCNGGWPYGAYAYVISAGGLDSEAAYPYTAEDGNSGNCNFSTQAIVATISNWQYVTQDEDENAMLSWVNNNGPLSICVDASSWSYYTGGVIQSCTDSLDHCVQLTGYDTVQGIDSWNVRNSWGSDWGNNGYIWLARGNNTCGLADVVTAVSI